MSNPPPPPDDVRSVLADAFGNELESAQQVVMNLARGRYDLKFWEAKEVARAVIRSFIKNRNAAYDCGLLSTPAGGVTGTAVMRDALKLIEATCHVRAATIARDALRSDAVAADPVAWRTPMVSKDHYQLTSYDDVAERWRSSGVPVEPLYAAPPVRDRETIARIIDPDAFELQPHHQSPHGKDQIRQRQHRACAKADEVAALYPPAPVSDARKALDNLADKISAKIIQLRNYRESDCQLDHARTIADGRLQQADQILGWVAEAAVQHATAPVSGRDAEDDETYEIGKRDGYEDAIQNLDLATGGDGEFKGSTIPGGTVDVPAMQERIIARCRSSADETGWLIEKDDPPVYCLLTGDYDEHWTPEVNRALRFARREDAQAYSDHIGWTSPPVRIVEHTWPDTPIRSPNSNHKESGT